MATEPAAAPPSPPSPPPAAPEAPDRPDDEAMRPPPEGAALDQTFTADTLYALRSTVAAHGSELGLDGARLTDLVLIAHELAANAVRHGGVSAAAPGRLRLWRADGRVVCEVSDNGPGLADPEAGTRLVGLHASGGRGLWIARAVADSIVIAAQPGGGTTVTLTIDPAAPPEDDSV